MNRIARIALAAFVALVLTFGGGWYYGSRRATARGHVEADATYALAAARGRLLEGRLELYSNNFGNASTRFDQAKGELARAIGFLESEGTAQQVTALRQATTTIDTAIQHANRLEHAAHESAASALKAIDGVIDERSRAPR